MKRHIRLNELALSAGWHLPLLGAPPCPPLFEHPRRVRYARAEITQPPLAKKHRVQLVLPCLWCSGPCTWSGLWSVDMAAQFPPLFSGLGP